MARFRSFTTAATAAAAVSAFCLPALAEKNIGAGIAATSPVAVAVKVPAPWYAPRFLVTSKMLSASGINRPNRSRHKSATAGPTARSRSRHKPAGA
jgi:hypothetical protein